MTLNLLQPTFDDQLAAFKNSPRLTRLTRENVETLLSQAIAENDPGEQDFNLNDYYDDIEEVIELIQDKNLSSDVLNSLAPDLRKELLKTVFRRDVDLEDIDITDQDELGDVHPFSFFVFNQIENYTAGSKEDYLDLSDFCFSRRNDFDVEYENSSEEFETKNIKDFAKARLDPDRFYDKIVQSNDVRDFKALLRSDKLTFDPTKVANLAEKPKLLNELYKTRFKDNKDKFVDLLKAITRLETKSAYAIRENLNAHYREMDKGLLDVVNENLRSQADQQAIDNAKVKYKQLVGEKKDLIEQLDDNKQSKPSLSSKEMSIGNNIGSILSLAVVGLVVALSLLPTAGLAGPALIASAAACSVGAGLAGWGGNMLWTISYNKSFNSTQREFDENKLHEKLAEKNKEVNKAKKILDELESPYKRNESEVSAPTTHNPLHSRDSSERGVS